MKPRPSSPPVEAMADGEAAVRGDPIGTFSVAVFSDGTWWLSAEAADGCDGPIWVGGPDDPEGEPVRLFADVLRQAVEEGRLAPPRTDDHERAS